MLYRINFSPTGSWSGNYRWYLEGQKMALVPISGKPLSPIKTRWNCTVTELEPPASFLTAE